MKNSFLLLMFCMPVILHAQFGFQFERSGNMLFRDWNAGNFFNNDLSKNSHLSLMLNNPYFIPNTFQSNLEYGKRLDKRSANVGIGYGIFSAMEFNSHLVKVNISKDLGDLRIGGTYFLSWIDDEFFEDFPYYVGGVNFWTSYSNSKSQAVFLMQYVYPSAVLLEPNEMRLAFRHKLSKKIDLYCDFNHFLQRGFYAKFAVDLNISKHITLGSGFTLNGKELFFSFIYSSGEKWRLRTNGSISSPMGGDIWADGLLKLK